MATDDGMNPGNEAEDYLCDCEYDYVCEFHRNEEKLETWLKEIRQLKESNNG
jgi:hypothetical protein